MKLGEKLNELHAGSMWYAIPPDEQTRLQRLAARTKGWVTPGNAATIIGGLLTLVGLACLLNEAYWAAFILISVGRLCDVLDGHIARSTRTSGPVGEGLDAAIDKVVVLCFTAVIIFGHYVFAWILVPVVMVQVLIALIVLAARRIHLYVHPTRLGKYTTFMVWVSALLFLLAAAVNSYIPYRMSEGLMLLALLGSVITLLRYVRTIDKQLLQRKQKDSL